MTSGDIFGQLTLRFC